MNIIVNSDRTVEKEYTEKDGSQNENRVTELNFTLPEEYSGEGFVPKIAFITEDGNFSDYIDNGKYILKNNITKYREVICFVWLTNSVNNIDFRSQTFPLEFYYNEDPSDYIPSEQEKSQIELLMEELEEKIQEVTELEENVYTKDETYSKEEVDEIIPTDISDLNNDSGFIDKDVNNLTNYYKKSESYTKQEIDGKISSVYKYKGTVASYNNLPSTGLTIGDVYNVEDTGDNYAWTGTDWDKLGGDIDLSGYQEKIDNSHKLNADLVDDTSTTHKFTSTSEKNSWNAKYDKPSGGIPSTDMSSNVQASLEKAETAIQDVSGKEDKSNKTGILDENSTDTQYPNAKAVYDNFVTRDEEIEKLQTENAQLLADHPDILDENNEFPSGTDLTLNGTGDLKMSVDVGGNSTQIQYEGYNLLPNTAQSQTISGVTFTVNDDKTILVNGTASAYIEYTISRLQTINFEENEKIYLLGCPTGGSDNTYTLSGNSSASLTDYGNGKNMTVSAGGISINGVIKIKNGTVCNNLLFKPMVISGNTKKPYEPFVGNQISPNPNYKQDINNVEGNVVVKGSSKNLADIDSIKIGKSWTDDNNSSRACLYIDVKPNSNYVISLYGIENMEEIGLIEKANAEATSTTAPIIQISTALALRTTSNNTNILVVQFIKANISLEDFKNVKVQIVPGSTATPYVPHAENTVTFPLSQGQKLMLGDTLEDDGIHHKRGQIVLTGNENISSSIYGTNSYILGLPARAFVDETITLILSSHFKGIPANQRTTEPPNCIYVSTASLIEVRNTEFATLQEFKAWLAQQYANNTPVIVEYKLETETIDPYTSAQQTAYNKLKEMQSYYDLTYVVGSSDNAQPIITAQAKKSLKVIQDEIDEIKQAILNS